MSSPISKTVLGIMIVSLTLLILYPVHWLSVTAILGLSCIIVFLLCNLIDAMKRRSLTGEQLDKMIRQGIDKIKADREKPLVDELEQLEAEKPTPVKVTRHKADW